MWHMHMEKMAATVATAAAAVGSQKKIVHTFSKQKYFF
jgi:hypothetical protein